MTPHAKPATDTSTFVLLHGAWHGAWCWKHVSGRLRAAGHRVYTPTLTGLGERSHLLGPDITLETCAQDLINVFLWEDLDDVVLVGHSFGGIAASAAADRIPERIRHLVYLDSLIIQSGESPFSVVPPDVAQARRDLARQSPGGLSIPVPPPEAFGVTDAADAQWLREKCTPHPVSTYESTLTLRHPVGNGLPTSYIAVRPEYAPLAAVRQWARSQKNWDYLEMDAGHDAMVTSPDALVELMLGISASSHR
ncbi:MAG: alpha/beta hydrolase [Burkholderiaceae bacterium]